MSGPAQEGAEGADIVEAARIAFLEDAGGGGRLLRERHFVESRAGDADVARHPVADRPHVVRPDKRERVYRGYLQIGTDCRGERGEIALGNGQRIAPKGAGRQIRFGRVQFQVARLAQDFPVQGDGKRVRGLSNHVEIPIAAEGQGRIRHGRGGREIEDAPDFDGRQVEDQLFAGSVARRGGRPFAVQDVHFARTGYGDASVFVGDGRLDDVDLGDGRVVGQHDFGGRFLSFIGENLLHDRVCHDPGRGRKQGNIVFFVQIVHGGALQGVARQDDGLAQGRFQSGQVVPQPGIFPRRELEGIQRQIAANGERVVGVGVGPFECEFAVNCGFFRGNGGRRHLPQVQLQRFGYFRGG